MRLHRYQRGSRAWKDAVVNGSDVVAAPPPDLLIDGCEVAWTATTGLLRTVNATPTAGGSGYTAGDILDVTTGGAGGKVQVSTVDGGGAVTAIATAAYAGGYGGYTTGTGKATSGGTGTGCTVNITAITNATTALVASPVHDGSGAIRTSISSSSNPIRSLLAFRAVSPPSLAPYSRLKAWVYLDDTTLDIATGEFEICLCSDTVGRVVVDRFIVTGPASAAVWAEQIAAREGAGALGANIQSIALYRGGVVHVAGLSALAIDNIRVSA